MNFYPKFVLTYGTVIKLSEDQRSATCVKPLDSRQCNWIFSENLLPLESEFQIQIIQMVLNHSHSIEFGLIVEHSDVTLQSSGKNNSFLISWLWREDIIYHKSEENYKTAEKYNFNLLNLKEGDLLGLKLSNNQLFFTYNGILLNKAADIENHIRNVRVALNLSGRVSFVSIIAVNNPLRSCHLQRYQEQLNKFKNEQLSHEESQNGRMVQLLHDKCGSEIQLSNNFSVATRKNPIFEFRNAVVVSQRALVDNNSFSLCIEGIINKWNGSIEFGVTVHDPNTSELPATLTNLRQGTLVLSGNSILFNGHSHRTPYSTKSLDDLCIGETIGVIRYDNGNIHFILNNQELDVAGNIPCSTPIWAIADLYGRTIKISVISKLNSSSLNQEIPAYQQRMIPIDSIDSIQFHDKCGSNIQLSENKLIAKRKNDVEFNNGIIFTNRKLRIGELFCIRVTKSITQWAGNLEWGITTIDPEQFHFPLTMTDVNIGCNLMMTQNGLLINGVSLQERDCARAAASISLTDGQAQSADIVSDVVSTNQYHSLLCSDIPALCVGCILAVELLDPQHIQFYFNGADLGPIELPDSSGEFYGVVDLYGRAAEIQICSEQDLLDDNLCISETGDGVEQLSIRSPRLLEEDEEEEDDLYDNDEIQEEEDDDTIEEATSYTRTSINRTEDTDVPYDKEEEADKEVHSIFADLMCGDQSFSEGEESEVTSPIKFHCLYGENVLLSDNLKVAKRPCPSKEFKNAIVMSSRALDANELFEINVDQLMGEWSGTLELGVTLLKPDEIIFPPTLSHLDKSSWILSGSSLLLDGQTVRNNYQLDMDKVTVNSRIGILRQSDGTLNFYQNGLNMGAAFFDVPAGIYAIVDLYGQCSQISITKRCGKYISNSSAENADMNNNLFYRSIIDRQELTDGDTQSNSQLMQTISEMINYIKKAGPKETGYSNDKIHDTQSDDVTWTEIKRMPLFHQPVFGNGILCNHNRVFIVNRIDENCIVQSSCPLEVRSYYEIGFYHNSEAEYILAPLSFGLVSDKFFSSYGLPDNLHRFDPPVNLLVDNCHLYVHNHLTKKNFIHQLARFTKRVTIGIHVMDCKLIQLFVNGDCVGYCFDMSRLENCYFICNLKSWYNMCIPIQSSYVPNIPVKSSVIPQILPIYRNHMNYIFTKERCKTTAIDEKEVDVNDDNYLKSISNSTNNSVHLILQEIYRQLPHFMKLTLELTSSSNHTILDNLIHKDPQLIDRIIGKMYNGQYKSSRTLRQLVLEELTGKLASALYTNMQTTGSTLDALDREAHSVNHLTKLIRRRCLAFTQRSDCTSMCQQKNSSIEGFINGDIVAASNEVPPPTSIHNQSMIIVPNHLVPHITTSVISDMGEALLVTSCHGGNCDSTDNDEDTSDCDGDNACRDDDLTEGSGVIFINQIMTTSQISSQLSNCEIQLKSTQNDQSMSLGMIMLPKQLFLSQLDVVVFLRTILDNNYNHTAVSSSHATTEINFSDIQPDTLHKLLMTQLLWDCSEPAPIVFTITNSNSSLSTVFMYNDKVISSNIPLNLAQSVAQCDRFSFSIYSDNCEQDDDVSAVTDWELYLHCRHSNNNHHHMASSVTNAPINIKLASATQLMFDEHFPSTDQYRLIINPNTTKYQSQLMHNVKYYCVPFVWINRNIQVTITKTPKYIVDEKHNRSYYSRVKQQSHSSRHLPVCSVIKRALIVKSILCICEQYFLPLHSGLVCFCSQCSVAAPISQEDEHNRHPSEVTQAGSLAGSDTLTNGVASVITNNQITNSEQELFIKGEPAKQFRLPLGWVKFNLRLRMEHRCYLSIWHLAYLTVPYGFINQLLTIPNPLNFLQQLSLNNGDPMKMQLAWLQSINNERADNQEASSNITNANSIIVSPWQPLDNWKLTRDLEEEAIDQLPDAFINYFDTHNKTNAEAMIALEVRVKPNSYRTTESISENNELEKRKSQKDKYSKDQSSDDRILLNSTFLNASSYTSSINQRTVWVMNKASSNELNLIISGLLIKI